MPPERTPNELIVSLAKYGVGAIIAVYVVWQGSTFIFGSLNGKLDKILEAMLGAKEATIHSNQIHEEMLQAIRDLGPRYTYRPEPRP